MWMLEAEVLSLVFLKSGKRIVSKSFKAGTVRMINNMVNDKVWLEIEKWIKMNTKGIEKIQLLGSGGNINKVFKLSNIKDREIHERTRI